MSSHLSPAQALPTYVLRSILKWVVKERRSPIFGNRYQLDYLRELLTVCSTWRREVLELMWRQLDLAIDSTTNEVDLDRPTWVKDNRLPANAANLVKEIHVSVTMHDVVSGIAYRILSDYIGDTKCFPLANKIHVLLSDYNIQSIDTEDVDTAPSNALEFANLLKSMASAASNVALMLTKGQSQGINDIDSVSSDVGEAALIRFANVLYANAKCGSLNMFNAGLETLSITDHIPLLSSLTIKCMESPDVSSSLIRKSASMLRYLYVEIRDANKLIYFEDGGAVVYSNLNHLHMLSCVRDSADAMTMPTKVVPFPVLRILTLNKQYPLNDDIILRGNSATLEFLSFEIDEHVVAICNRYKTFENKHKILRHVTIQTDMEGEDLSLIPKADMGRYLNNLVSAASRVKVSRTSIAKLFTTAAQHDQMFQNIKTFDIFPEELSLFDLLNLLSVLPGLVNFSGRIGGLGPELENISVEELPDHIASAYCDVGKSLQVISMKYSSRQRATHAVDCIFLLALVSPKLRRIEVLRNDLEHYNIRVAEALSSGLYIKYESQLYRVINSLCE